MANCAECAIAIAKKDIELLNGAIARDDKKGGINQVWEYEIVKAENIQSTGSFIPVMPEERHKVIRYSKAYRDKDDNPVEDNHYEVDGVRMSDEEYNVRYRESCVTDWDTYKCLVDEVYDKGWCVNWKKLNSYSYEMDTQVDEFDDHITVYFGGRWSFPESLENTLNDAGVLWQGAEAESGCDILNDELGNEYFGLECLKERDEDGYLNYYVEDISEKTKENK